MSEQIRKWYSKTRTQYDELLKKQCVELVVKEGRTIVSVKKVFGLGNGTLNDWIK